MRKLGYLIAFYGLFAIVLNFGEGTASLLIWMYEWGDGVAWAIKITILLLGVGMYLLGKPDEEEVKLVAEIDDDED